MIETICFIVIVVIEIVVIELRSNGSTNSNCVVTFNKDVFAEGAERKTSDGYRYCAYTGIPYAVPPVDTNRFEVCLVCRNVRSYSVSRI